MALPLHVSSVEIEELLLLLKAAFLVLLYLFIWRIVRTASRDLRLPQESFVLTPEAREQREQTAPGRLLVLTSPALPPDYEHLLDSLPVSVGRDAGSDIVVERDDFASARHATFTPRRDGVWLTDDGSTNGTFVNGVRLEGARRLQPGDIVRVGETEFRFER